MGTTTSLVIPIRDDYKLSDLNQLLCEMKIFLPYIEETVPKTKTVKQWIFFTRHIKEMQTRGYGTKINEVPAKISEFAEGELPYKEIGGISNDVNAKIQTALDSGNNETGKGDWCPWEISLQRNVMAEWGDDTMEIVGTSLCIEGYGNPIGNGTAVLKRICTVPEIGEIIDKIGKPSSSIKDNDCVYVYNGKMIAGLLSA